MVKGAVQRYADGSKLEGDVFGWIEVLQNLSAPNFHYDSTNPFANIMADVAPFELAQIVDCAIRKHRLDISNLKDVERDCQALEIACMVEQAYIAGAREMFLEGLNLGIVPHQVADEVRASLKIRWEGLWRKAAGLTFAILARVNQNVHAKGRKSRPPTTTDVNSLKGILDDSVLNDLHSRAPANILLVSDEYANHMNAGIVPEVKRYIREGKLSGGAETDFFQDHVDKHSKRIRHRLEGYFERFRQKAKL